MNDDNTEYNDTEESIKVDLTDIPTDFQSLTEVDSTALVAHMMSLDGVQDFNEDFMIWQEYLSRLESYDEITIENKLREVHNIQLIPEKKSADTYQSYYHMVEWQRYLYSVHTTVSNRVEMLKDATKTLRSSARGMFKGTDKDKEAHCDRMVRNFTAELSRAKTLLTGINNTIALIDFAATQASRILKEKEFELKINNPYMQKGQAGIYQNNNVEDEDDDNPIPAPYRKIT